MYYRVYGKRQIRVISLFFETLNSELNELKKIKKKIQTESPRFKFNLL